MQGVRRPFMVKENGLSDAHSDFLHERCDLWIQPRQLRAKWLRKLTDPGRDTRPWRSPPEKFATPPLYVWLPAE